MKTISLNNQQKKAVNHIEGPLLVLAGAGSGKTRVVTMKIAKLIEIGVDPTEILALTFTNKAANEMSCRIKQLTSRNVVACTFHSLGDKILRKSIQHLDYSNNFTIYDEDDSLKLIKECLISLKIKEDKGYVKKIKYKISTCKNDLIDLSDINNLSIFTKNEIEAFRLYQNKLKSFNCVDFDDLLYLPAKLFQENIDILTHYQDTWSFLLIDEYQDTNFAQYTIAKLLCANNQNICVVGDPDQSIYSWRGARYQNILNFDKDFKNAKIIKLEKNYRSTPTILNAANDLIKSNTSRYEKTLYSNLKDGEKIKVFQATSEQMEATFVVEKILKHHLKEKINLDVIAIFYRTNFQSRVFEDILLNQKIPYSIYGGISFYQRKEIKDILAFMKLIISNSDFLSFSRTINIYKKGFGKTTLNKLFFISERYDIPIINLLQKILDNPLQFKEIRLNINQKENLNYYLQNLYELRKNYKQKLETYELIIQIISKIKYYDYLKQDPDTLEDRKENVDGFITKATEWQEANNSSLEKFLEELSLASSKTQNSEERSLQLMTLHNSKGLEFECVFIVGLEEDLFPHVNSKNSFEEIEEERRLFYVGMTRAKKHLYITSSQTRFMFGGVKLSTPSRFLREIPNQYTKNLASDETEQDNFKYDEKSEFFNGQKVFHKTFGIGIIQKIYQSSYGQTFDILFEDGNITRSIVAKYAKLKII